LIEDSGRVDGSRRAPSCFWRESVCPGVLIGDGEGGGEFAGGAEREVGVAEGFAAEKGEVGVAGGDDGVGEGGGGDESYGGGMDVCLGADAGGEGDLIAGGGGDVGGGGDSAGGAIDAVDAEGLEDLGEVDGVFEGPAAFDVVGAGEADPEGEVVWPDGADG